MKLLTEEMKKKLPPLYSFENTPLQQTPIFCKFFTPDSSWTWFVTEGEQQEDGDWLLFGLVDGFDKELGYFSLDELESITGPLRLPIERDLWFEKKHLADVMEN